VVDPDVMRRRIDALARYVARLEAFRTTARDAFARDEDQHQLAERYLHLAVESTLDIAHHLIADRNLPTPDTYRDAFATLGREGLIDAPLAKRMQGWAGLRNVLVHAYLDVDHGLVWDAIQGELDDLRAYARAAASHL